MINVSIVIYNHCLNSINTLIQYLLKSERVSEIFVIDNSEQINEEVKNLSGITYIFNDSNLGYGRAHNIGIQCSVNHGTNYHLVVNPDIEFGAEDTLAQLETLMDNQQDIGLVMPKILYRNGELQYLCKRLPTPMDLFGRRFLPGAIKNMFTSAFDKYELRHKSYDEMMEVPNLSGCFMFMRTDALNKVGGFDDRYFMYMEDVDLVRRINQHYRTIYYPATYVYHGYQKASYNNSKLLRHHITSAIKYFSKWGWFIDSGRTKINRQLN